MYQPINLTIITVLLLLISCNDKDGDEIRIDEQANRTLLVYLARDNNLSSLSEEKMDYILQGWDGTGGNIVIYEDKAGQSPTLYKIVRENEENSLQVINRYDDENSASGQVLSRVIQEMKTYAPADSYGLLFFSHATGWLPEKVYEKTRTIGVDGDSEMSLIDFAGAIPGNTFDFIIFEACHMTGIEVLYELKDKTTYIVGSAAEIISPGFRDIYPEYINYLFSKEADLISFAGKAFEWVEKQPGAYCSGTLSVIQTNGIQPLANWLKENITEEFSGNYDDLQSFDRKATHLFYDFEDYYSRLVSINKQNQLKELTNNCVIYARATEGFFLGLSSREYPFLIDKHSGMTTYIMKEGLEEVNEAYKQLGWYKAVYE